MLWDGFLNEGKRNGRERVKERERKRQKGERKETDKNYTKSPGCGRRVSLEVDTLIVRFFL